MYWIKRTERFLEFVDQGSTSFQKSIYTLRFKGILYTVFKRNLFPIRYKLYILIKGYFQRFSNHAFHLLTYSVRSNSPQLFFQDLGSYRLLHLHCAGLILPRLYYVGIYVNALTIDTAVVIVSCVLTCLTCFVYLGGFMIMICILCMI